MLHLLLYIPFCSMRQPSYRLLLHPFPSPAAVELRREQHRAEGAVRAIHDELEALAPGASAGARASWPPAVLRLVEAAEARAAEEAAAAAKASAEPELERWVEAGLGRAGQGAVQQVGRAGLSGHGRVSQSRVGQGRVPSSEQGRVRQSRAGVTGGQWQGGAMAAAGARGRRVRTCDLGARAGWGAQQDSMQGPGVLAEGTGLKSAAQSSPSSPICHVSSTGSSVAVLQAQGSSAQGAIGGLPAPPECLCTAAYRWSLLEGSPSASQSLPASLARPALVVCRLDGEVAALREACEAAKSEAAAAAEAAAQAQARAESLQQSLDAAAAAQAGALEAQREAELGTELAAARAELAAAAGGQEGAEGAWRARCDALEAEVEEVRGRAQALMEERDEEIAALKVRSVFNVAC